MSKTGITDPDDGWGDLARELGLDPPPARPQAPAAEAEPEPEEEGDPLFAPADGQSDLFQEYEPDGGDAEAESDDGPEEGAEGEPTGEPGEEGPKKKRRRRRRRKKKGGETGEVAAPTATGEQDDEEDESEGEAEETAEDETEEDEEPARRAPVDDGGPTVEASRELIANWDVPSWEQIVAGLYRPGGR